MEVLPQIYDGAIDEIITGITLILCLHLECLLGEMRKAVTQREK